MLDVTVKMVIAAPPAQVAAIMFDAHREPEWIGGVRRTRVLTTGPFGIGSRVAREGAFLGRRFGWVTEVSAYEPQHLVQMVYVSGPFSGGVNYAISPTASGSEVAIHNHGKAKFRFPFMGAMLRASVSGDLGRLKRLAETSAREPLLP